MPPIYRAFAGPGSHALRGHITTISRQLQDVWMVGGVMQPKSGLSSALRGVSAVLSDQTASTQIDESSFRAVCAEHQSGSHTGANIFSGIDGHSSTLHHFTHPNAETTFELGLVFHPKKMVDVHATMHHHAARSMGSVMMVVSDRVAMRRLSVVIQGREGRSLVDPSLLLLGAQFLAEPMRGAEEMWTYYFHGHDGCVAESKVDTTRRSVDIVREFIANAERWTNWDRAQLRAHCESSEERSIFISANSVQLSATSAPGSYGLSLELMAMREAFVPWPVMAG